MMSTVLTDNNNVLLVNIASAVRTSFNALMRSLSVLSVDIEYQCSSIEASTLWSSLAWTFKATISVPAGYRNCMYHTVRHMQRSHS